EAIVNETRPSTPPEDTKTRRKFGHFLPVWFTMKPHRMSSTSAPLISYKYQIDK
ncbi:MAG: hypothetical protein ACI92E_001425, partial [Oceanicoccus sp.]